MCKVLEKNLEIEEAIQKKVREEKGMIANREKANRCCCSPPSLSFL